MLCQLVIDVAGELSARRGERFEDYTEAVRNLARDSRFGAVRVRRLERLPRFRNVAIDLRRVVEALDDLDPIEQFVDVVRQILASEHSAD